MLADLPEKIAQEVRYHLTQNDFLKAKAIHDEWVQVQPRTKPIYNEAA